MCGEPRACCAGAMATSLDDLKSPLFWRAVGAELLGTALLTLVGCGSCLAWPGHDPPSVVQIALCFGLAVATVVWTVGHVSGGHVNPAVSVAMLVTRNVSVVRGLLFIAAQVVGAVAGAGVLLALTPADARGSLGATVLGPGVTAAQGFGVEFFVTLVLVLTVFASCDSKRKDLAGSAPLSIGLAVTLCHLWAVKATGSSMNPARSFGPAVVLGLWHHHWVYWCGPILGGVVAAMIYENVFAANASVRKARGYLLASHYDPADFEENAEKPAKVLVEGEESETHTPV